MTSGTKKNKQPSRTKKEKCKKVHKHNCNNHKVTNCDGTFHHSFCSKCNKGLGITNCEG